MTFYSYRWVCPAVFLRRKFKANCRLFFFNIDRVLLCLIGGFGPRGVLRANRGSECRSTEPSSNISAGIFSSRSESRVYFLLLSRSKKQSSKLMDCFENHRIK